jgi:ParB family chromosome partitioning protein
VQWEGEYEVKKKVLGRGLEALLSADLRESVSETERVKELEIDRIDPNPRQPRNRFDEKQLQELAASIKQYGVLQPIVVRRSGERYQIVIGERRFRACKLAGRDRVPAIVRDVSSNDSLKHALMENLQREDLNPIEEAKGYQSLREEFGLSVKEIAEILGKDRSTVANTLRLLSLPESVISLIYEGKLTAGHARALLAIEGTREQIEWAKRVVEEGITVREIERVAPRRKGRRRQRRVRIDPEIHAIEERLEVHLGTRVRISPRRKGGVISVEYYSQEELEHILEKIGIDIAF